MTTEERFELHEQWLRSLDANLERFSATFSDAIAVVAQNQAHFSAALASVTQRLDSATERINQLAEETRLLAEQHRKLEQAIEGYFRFRANGGRTQ